MFSVTWKKGERRRAPTWRKNVACQKGERGTELKKECEITCSFTRANILSCHKTQRRRHFGSFWFPMKIFFKEGQMMGVFLLSRKINLVESNCLAFCWFRGVHWQFGQSEIGRKYCVWALKRYQTRPGEYSFKLRKIFLLSWDWVGSELVVRIWIRRTSMEKAEKDAQRLIQ